MNVGHLSLPLVGITIGAGVGAFLSEAVDHGMSTPDIGLATVLGVGGGVIGAALGHNASPTLRGVSGGAIGALTIGGGLAAAVLAANLLD